MKENFIQDFLEVKNEEKNQLSKTHMLLVDLDELKNDLKAHSYGYLHILQVDALSCEKF